MMKYADDVDGILREAELIPLYGAARVCGPDRVNLVKIGALNVSTLASRWLHRDARRADCNDME